MYTNRHSLHSDLASLMSSIEGMTASWTPSPDSLLLAVKFNIDCRKWTDRVS